MFHIKGCMFHIQSWSILIYLSTDRLCCCNILFLDSLDIDKILPPVEVYIFGTSFPYNAYHIFYYDLAFQEIFEFH